MQLQLSSRCASNTILEVQKRSKAASNFGEVRGVLEKRGHKQTGRKKMTEWKEEPDRGQKSSVVKRVVKLEE